MIGANGRTKVFAYCAPVDMRKGFEGLCGLVREQLGRDPLDGSLYLFTNKRRTRAKVLSFDGTGLWVYAKRLERERFVALWKFTDADRIPLTMNELELFLHGSHLIGRVQLAPAPMTDKDLAVGS
ncbi:MAG: IS66 family insertion sequence element accessory protein TnpB [Nannocystaceae bacterium]|nr:IS66 family insertion sequence element accessory protein TnpB [Nannocystaceae bacterium]